LVRTKMRKTLIYSHGAIFDNKLNPPEFRKKTFKESLIGEPHRALNQGFILSTGEQYEVPHAFPELALQIPHVESVDYCDPADFEFSEESATAMLRVVGRSLIVKTSSKWDKTLGCRKWEWDVRFSKASPLNQRDLYLSFFWDRMQSHDKTEDEFAEYLSRFPWMAGMTFKAVGEAARKLGLYKQGPKLVRR